MKMRDKIAVYEKAFHMIQLYGHVAMNTAKLQELLGLICSWSYAHRCGNGELDNDKLVEKELENLKKFLGI